MRKFFRIRIKGAARTSAAVVTAAAVIAGAGVTTYSYFTMDGVAHADTYVKLRNGRKVSVAPDGTKVVITSWNEHAIVSASITNNGLTRFAMVSDTAVARLNNSSATGTLSVGYIVGCQFDVSAAQLTGTITGTLGNFQFAVYPVPKLIVSPGGSLGLDANVPITPGVVSVVEVATQDIANGTGAVEVQDHQITATSGNNSDDLPCAGYAQARSYQKVVVKGGAYALTTALYGQPFGLG